MLNRPPNSTPSAEKEISEKMFHFLIMNYRNKHIAHSDNFLKSGIVGGCKFGSEYGFAPIIASRALIEDYSFYHSMVRLNHVAQLYIVEKLNLAQNKLLDLLKAGTASITDK